MNNLIQGQFPLVTQAEAEAGILSIIKNWTPERIKQAIDALSGGQTFARVVKKVDETVNNSSTLQDDDELFVLLSPNKVYFIILAIFGSGNSTADFKYAISLPTDATGKGLEGKFENTAPFDVSVDITSSRNMGITGSESSFILYARVTVLGNGGLLNVQWTQQLQTVGDTKCLKGASLLVWEELP